MDLERPTLRVFLLVAAVVVPALVALALVVVFAASWVEEVGVGTALLAWAWLPAMGVRWWR